MTYKGRPQIAAIDRMSEIFNFLKENLTDKDKPVPVSEPKPEQDKPVSESPGKVVKEASEDSTPGDLVPIETRIIKADKFDLANAGPQLKVALDPLTIVGEQFRLLRTKLGMLKKQNGIKTILVTSSVPEEGKTFSASSLAGVFAQEPGKRVVLIDCDMRKPQSGRNLGIHSLSDHKGLSEILEGNIGISDTLFKSMDSEFYFLPSGPLPPNPTELLSSPILEQTIKSAVEKFDWVVIDSPPVLALSDASLLFPLCDAVILVIRANSTPSKLVKNTIERIGKDKICGIVINRQKQGYSSRYYYKNYYGGFKKQKD